MEISDALRSELQKIRETWKRDKAATYTCYDDLLQRYPEHPMVLREYGKALYMENDDLDKACYLLEHALEHEPDALLSWLYLGQIYHFGYGKGYPEAVKLYYALIQTFPNHNIMACVEAYLRIGSSHDLPGVSMSMDEAINAFCQASLLAPDRSEPYECLSQILYEAKDYRGAREALQKALQLKLQQKLPVNSVLLMRLKSLEEGKPWNSGSYPLAPSMAFHWPDEVLE